MMAELLNTYWNEFVSRGDVRTNQLWLIKDPSIVLAIIAVYLLLVCIGPRLMEHRAPFECRSLLIIYNLCHVQLSMWMAREFIMTSFLNPNFDLICERVNPQDTSPMAMRLINVHWWYFFSKILEFLDTMFFVLRKKNNQISFLHVYHHIGVLCLTWGNVKFSPGAVSYFGPLLNCFVHTVMYTYYMLSAFGPHMQKYLWWKRYITQMQMTQFVVMIAFICNVMRLGCVWLVFCYTMIGYLFSLLFLFLNFYVKAFLSRRSVKDKKKE